MLRKYEYTLHFIERRTKLTGRGIMNPEKIFHAE